MLSLSTTHFLIALLIFSNSFIVKGQSESEGDKEDESEPDNSDVETAIANEHSADEKSDQEEGSADVEEERPEGRSGPDHQQMKGIKMRPTRRRRPVAAADPLYCYSCKYQHNATNDICLDPGKNDVDSKECKMKDSQCFTFMQMSNDNEDLVDSVVRGCKSNCGSSREFTCCGTPMCNSQVFMMMMSHAAHFEGRHNLTTGFTEASNSNQVVGQSVLSFISALVLAWGH